LDSIIMTDPACSPRKFELIDIIPLSLALIYHVPRLAMACRRKLSLCLRIDTCVPIPFASSSAVAALVLIDYVSRCIPDSFLHPF
jgi:hypothetical protein